MKKFISVILCIAMIICSLPVYGFARYSDETANEPQTEAVKTIDEIPVDAGEAPQLTLTETVTGTCGDDLTWELTTDGTLTISGTGAMTNWGSSSSVPWYSYRSNITTLVVESGVTTIGIDAFWYCTSLSSIDLPSGLTSIGHLAFAYCTSLSSIDLPSGLTSIGSNPFYYCTSLSSINVDSVNTYFCDIDGVLFNYVQTELICYPAGKTASSYIVPTTVTSIDDYAFYNCRSLSSIDLPSGLTSIGIDAFASCTSLSSIDLPSGLTSIGNYTFFYCTSLSSIDLPSGLTSIDDYAFYNCRSLSSIDLPSGLTSIGSETFDGCTSLSSIDLPSGVTSIGSNAFYNCRSLSSIDLPSGVTSIGSGAFRYCSKLASAYFYGGAPTCGFCAFSGTASGFTIYYIEGKSGWTTPKWKSSGGDTYNTATFVPVNSIASISITEQPDKIVYFSGETFDPTGMTVTAIYSDGTKSEITDYSIEPSDALSSDDCFVEIKYGDFSAYADILVCDSYSIEDVYVTGIDEPASGNTPDTSALTKYSELYTVDSLSWLPSDGNFETNVRYTVSAVLSPVGSWFFDSNTQGYINGRKASASLNKSTGKLTLTYKFDTTEKNIKYTIIVFGEDGILSDIPVSLADEVEITDETGAAKFDIASGQTAKLIIAVSNYITLLNTTYVTNDEHLDIIQLYKSPVILSMSCNKDNVITGKSQINNRVSDKKAEIIITANANQEETQTFKIVQDGIILAENTNGHFEIPNTAFKKDVDVYAVLETDGYTDTKKMNIDVVSFGVTIPQLPILGGLKVTIPESFPIIGGLSINTSSGLSIKQTTYTTKTSWKSGGVTADEVFKYSLDNDSMCVTIGMEVDKDLTKLNKGLKKYNLEHGKKATDKTLDITPAAYFVITYDKYGVVKATGNLMVNVSYAFSVKRQYVVIAIPIVVTVKMTASGEIAIENIGYDFDAAQWTIPDASLTLKGTPSVTAAVGGDVGIAGAGAGVYVEASTKLEMDLLPRFSLNAITLEGDIGVTAYAYVKILGVKIQPEYKQSLMKGSVSYNFVSKTLTGDYGFLSSAAELSESLYNESSYALVDRDYLANQSEWLSTCSVELSERVDGVYYETLDHESVYGGLAPQIVKCGDTIMMVFLDDDGDETDEYNFQHLYYSLYDKSTDTWSLPVKIDDNDLIDAEYKLCTDGSDIYMAFTEAKRMFTVEDANDSEAFLSAMEVKAAKYNFETDEFDISDSLTDNDVYDLLPKIVVSDGVPTLLFVESADNNMFAMSACNSLCYCAYSDGSWSAPTEIADSLAGIASFDAGILDGSVCAAVITDTDCDFSTDDDRETYIYSLDGTGKKLETGIASNLSFTSFGGDNILTWYKDSNIYMIDSADAEVGMLFEDPIDSLSSAYTFIETDDGHFTIVYREIITDDDNTGSDLMAIVYNNGWGLPVKITNTESNRYVDAFDGVYIDGDLLVSYMKTEAVITDDGMTTSSDLCHSYITFGEDITVSDVTADYEDIISSGDIGIEATVTSNSVNDISALNVTVTDPEGTNIFSETVQIGLKAGDTAAVEFDLPRPDTLIEGEYIVAICAANETDSSDNSASVRLLYTDLAVTAERKTLGEKNYLLYTVINNGNSSGSCTLTLTRTETVDDSEATVTLASIDVGTVEAGDIVYALIDPDSYADFYPNGENGAVITVISNNDDEYVTENNSAAVYIKAYEQPEELPEILSNASSISENYAIFDKYAPCDILVTIMENGNEFVGITGIDTSLYSLSDDTVSISSDAFENLDDGEYEYSFDFTTDAGTQNIAFYVTVTDSTPQAPGITAEQVYTLDDDSEKVTKEVIYDGSPVEADVDFIIETDGSDGKLDYLYSAYGENWVEGLPTDAGTYTVKVTVGVDPYNNMTAAETVFTLKISKRGRSIGYPEIESADGSNVALKTVEPTVGEGEILYGWSEENSTDSVVNWQESNIFTEVYRSQIVYFFAMVTEDTNYNTAYSSPVILITKFSDINGDNTVNIIDVIQLRLYINQYSTFIEAQIAAWDIDGDGDVDDEDIAALQIIILNA